MSSTCYDPHERCREELRAAYAAGADDANLKIKQIVRRFPDGTHEILKVLQVDLFLDGVRILVE